MYRLRDANIDEKSERVAAELAERIDEKSMGTSVALFLSAHRPLAFFAGQLMQSMEPLIGLFDLPWFSDFAKLLSMPGGIEHIENALLQATENEKDDDCSESRHG